MTAGYIITTVY